MKLCFLILVCLSTTTMAKEKKYKTHPERVNALIAAIDHDTANETVINFGKRAKKRNKILYQLERGRVYQIQGEFEKSKAAFDQALQFIKEKEDQAVVSASKAAANVGAAAVNDKMIPYRDTVTRKS